MSEPSTEQSAEAYFRLIGDAKAECERLQGRLTQAESLLQKAEEKLSLIDTYADHLATDRNFKPLSIAEDLRLILDGYPPDTPMPGGRDE